MELNKNIKNKFYVYVYLDPRKSSKYVYGEYSFDFEPFYIGKGSGLRHRGHLWEANSVINNDINRTKKPNLNWEKIYKIIKIYKTINKWPIILKIKENLSELDAHKLEKQYVSIIGRLDLETGPLLNLTDGGDSPKNPSKKTREKMKNNRIGKHHSEKTKIKMSKSQNNVSPKQKIFDKYGDEAQNVFDEIIQRRSEKQLKIILQYSKEGVFVMEHKGIEKIAKKLGVDSTNISACARGKTKSIAGFMWKYKEN